MRAGVLLFVWLAWCSSVQAQRKPAPVARPQTAEQFLVQGVALGERGQLAQAITAFREAVRLNPSA
jgi:Flp pilus assembly protein TadD